MKRISRIFANRFFFLANIRTFFRFEYSVKEWCRSTTRSLGAGWPASAARADAESVSGSFVEPGAHASARMTHYMTALTRCMPALAWPVDRIGRLRAGWLFIDIGVVGAHFCQAFRSRKIHPAARMRSLGLALRKVLLSLSCSARFSVFHGEKFSLACLVFFSTSRNLRQMENRRRSVRSVKRRSHITVELRTSKRIWSASTHTPSKWNQSSKDPWRSQRLGRKRNLWSLNAPLPSLQQRLLWTKEERHQRFDYGLARRRSTTAEYRHRGELFAPVFLLGARLHRTMSHFFLLRKYSGDTRWGKVSVKNELAKASGICPSTDIWTSRAAKAYNTATVHFIDGDWSLRTGVLETASFPGSHTGVTHTHTHARART